MAKGYSVFSLLKHALKPDLPWGQAWEKPTPRSSYDVVIIGGGGHGLATAYYLAKNHGITNVAVLERSYIGSGNVGRNTTLIRSNYVIDGNTQFFEHSMKLWEGLSHDLNYNCMVSQRGQIVLAVSPVQMDVFARHDAVAWGYARAASQLGVHVIENCEVTGMVIDNGRITGVETTQGRINAGKVGIAVAGHTSEVARMAGLKLPVESHILQAFVTETVKPIVHHVVSWGAELFYLSQSDKGGLVFGGHIDGFNTYTQRGQLFKIQDVMQCAVSLMPFMSRMRLLRHWGGIQDMTPDGSPFICRTPVRDLYLNGGWCYQGFKATPASGWTFAHTIANDSEHDLNRCYSLDRFEKGREMDDYGIGNWTFKQ